MTFKKTNSLLHFCLLLPWDSACYLSGPRVSRPLPEHPATTQPCAPDICACSAISGTTYPPCSSEQPGRFHVAKGSGWAWRRPRCDASKGKTLRLLKNTHSEETVAQAVRFALSSGRLNPTAFFCDITCLAGSSPAAPPWWLGACCPRGNARPALSHCPALCILGTRHPTQQTLPSSLFGNTKQSLKNHGGSFSKNLSRE